MEHEHIDVFVTVKIFSFSRGNKVINVLKWSLIYKIDFIYLSSWDVITTRLIYTQPIIFETIIS